MLGLSGGIDSAVVCYLAAAALGAQNVLAVRMPYRTSSQDSLDDAQKVMDAGIPLVIYDRLGRTVTTLADRPLPAGEHTAVWNGRDDRGVLTASGTYLYELRAGTFTAKGKLLFLR